MSRKAKSNVKPNSRKARLSRKNHRNSGKAYVTAKGKHIRAKVMKPLKDCRALCKTKIDESKRKIIFQEYWDMTSYDKRSSYAGSLIDFDEIESCRPSSEHHDKIRQISPSYHLCIDGKRSKVCKGCFMDTFAETENFLKVVISKKRQSTAGIISRDQRGLGTPANAYDESKFEEVRQHIQSFPAYESHYTRKKSSKKYLPSYLTISKMYSLYQETTSKPVGEKLYRREFRKLNLKIKKPKADTCETCDKLKMKILMTINEKERKQLIKQRDDHLTAAQKAYDEKGNDTKLAIANAKKICATFDMQQCLPTPSLTASIAFYKRLLWTFNLTVNNNASCNSDHFMWHEVISNRGANQIASCLYFWLKSLPSEVEHVTLYSDTCGGQNKNSHVAAMFTYFLSTAKTNIKVIDHKFLVPGHTHMEADGAHGVIEKKKGKVDFGIYVPEDWMKLVRLSSSKFHVKEMKKKNFYNFASLLKGPLVLRKKDATGKSFKWHDAQWFRYEKSELFGRIKYKNSLNASERFKTLCLRRRGISSGPYPIELVSNTRLPISTEKKNDLMALMHLIPEECRPFYIGLPDSQNPDLNNYPDIEEIDPDNEGWETDEEQDDSSEESETD